MTIRLTLLAATLSFSSIAQPQLGLRWAKAVEGYNIQGQSFQVQGEQTMSWKSQDIYYCGKFIKNGDFNPGPGVDSIMNPLPYLNSWISRFDTAGNYSWTKVAPGPGAYALDTAGNIYVAGVFDGTRDFDPGPGTSVLTAVYNDLYLMKLDRNYNFIWAKNTGTCGSELVVTDLKINSAGGIHIGGYFSGLADFHPGSSTLNVDKFQSSARDGFLLKFSPAGNFLWASDINGPGGDNVMEIALDPAGNPIITGYTGIGLSQPVMRFKGAGPVYTRQVDANNSDGYLASYTATGAVNWAKVQRGGTMFPYAVTADASGNIYFTGVCANTVVLDSGNVASTITGNIGLMDAFVAKFSSEGAFVWAKVLGSTGDDGITAVRTEPGGDVFLSGYSTGAINVAPGSASPVSYPGLGFRDIFTARYTGAGTYKWSTHAGSINHDEPADLHLMQDGSLLATGYVSGSADFSTPGAGGQLSLVRQLPSANYQPAAYLLRYQYPQGNSGTSIATGPDNAPGLMVYPNPASSIVTVSADFPGAGNAAVTLCVIDAFGSVVRTEVVKLRQGILATSIDLENNMPSGIYHIVITAGNTRLRKPLTVLR